MIDAMYPVADANDYVSNVLVICFNNEKEVMTAYGNILVEELIFLLRGDTYSWNFSQI